MNQQTNYIVSYPRNTKEVTAQNLKFSLVVLCPHCNERHYHNKACRYMAFLEAPCGKGYYVIRVKK